MAGVVWAALKHSATVIAATNALGFAVTAVTQVGLGVGLCPGPLLRLALKSALSLGPKAQAPSSHWPPLLVCRATKSQTSQALPPLR